MVVEDWSNPLVGSGRQTGRSGASMLYMSALMELASYGTSEPRRTSTRSRKSTLAVADQKRRNKSKKTAKMSRKKNRG